MAWPKNGGWGKVRGYQCAATGHKLGTIIYPSCLVSPLSLLLGVWGFGKHCQLYSNSIYMLAPHQSLGWRPSLQSISEHPRAQITRRLEPKKTMFHRYFNTQRDNRPSKLVLCLSLGLNCKQCSLYFWLSLIAYSSTLFCIRYRAERTWYLMLHSFRFGNVAVRLFISVIVCTVPPAWKFGKRSY